eukprot:6588348-Pyramimonas_sp.AAC.1
MLRTTVLMLQRCGRCCGKHLPHGAEQRHHCRVRDGVPPCRSLTAHGTLGRPGYQRVADAGPAAYLSLIHI